MKKNKIWTVIGAGMLSIGIGMTGYTLWQMNMNSRNQQEALEKIQTIIEENKHSTVDPPAITTSQKKWKTGDVIGILEIPGIQKELPIVEGTDEDDLAKGVGHYAQSSLPGGRNQILLSGHRDTVFRQLGTLKTGDALLYKDTNSTYEYTIYKTYIVKSSNKEVIRNTAPEEILTLSTCYPFYFVGDAPDRYIIEAKRKTE
ncbi:class D sortase [Bacillus sp. 1P06AnD]|uniref:class D sortase n=1 Tax=Bacillus sp. 1P06AnD TaxID=3132208 RepID=UPI0039A0F475